VGLFDALAPIGRGGMGTVWRGVHRASGVPVAIKALRPELASNEEALDLFRTEVRAAASLDHPGIVTLLDYGTLLPVAEVASGGVLRAGSPYLVMEHSSGGTLSRRLGTLEWPTARELLLGLLEALAHAHARGVVHGDIKPSNILMPGPGDLRPLPKLADFGLARLRPSPHDGLLAPSPMGGSPSYVAPEQLRDDPLALGPWTDLYSLGCLAWALLTAELPRPATDLLHAIRLHERDRLPRFVPVVMAPEGIEDWLVRLLEVDPGRRFQHAADAARALVAIEDGSPAGRPGRPPDWRTTRRPGAPPRLLGAGLGLHGLRRPTIVGREAERDRLWAALGDVTGGGQTRFVLLRGAAGTGKSRLASWLCGHAAELGLAQVARAVHGAAPSPSDGIGPMFARLLRVDFADPEDLEQRVVDHLQRLGDDRPTMARALATIADENRTVPLPRRVRFRSPAERYAVLAAYLESACRDRPVVLWLDDLQWGLDAAQLVAYLLARGRRIELPVLLVGTCRDEALEAGTAVDQHLHEILRNEAAQAIELKPLPWKDGRRLVVDLIGLSEATAEGLPDRAAGNPLFAVQLVADWVERGVLVLTPAGFVLRYGVSPALPDDIHALWVRRLQRVVAGFAAEAGRSLEVAAVLGREVDLREWSECCVAAGWIVPQGLVGALAREGLILARPRGWAFGHGLLRESLERLARDGDRWRGVNEVVAEHLVTRPGGAAPERLGRLWVEAERPREAGRALKLATKLRRDRGEYDAARALIELRRRVLPALPRSEATVERLWMDLDSAILLRFAHQREEAEAIVDAVLASADGPGIPPELRATAARESGIQLRKRGRPREAAITMRNALRIAEATGDRDLAARCQLSLSFTLRELDDLPGSRAAAERSADLYEQTGDEEARAVALGALAAAARMAGEAGPAAEILEENVRTLEGHGRLRRLGGTLLELGWTYLTLERYDEALEVTARAEALSRDTGDIEALGHSGNAKGEIARMQGDWETAEAAYAEAARFFAVTESRWSHQPLCNLALLRLAQDRFIEARDLLSEARAVAAAAGQEGVQTVLDVFLTAILAGLGAWAELDGLLDRLGTFEPGRTRVDRDTVSCLVQAVELAERAGRPERASRLGRLARAHAAALTP
jgi:tetratricopeptide (TPR) repeat protein